MLLHHSARTCQERVIILFYDAIVKLKAKLFGCGYSLANLSLKSHFGSSVMDGLLPRIDQTGLRQPISPSHQPNWPFGVFGEDVVLLLLRTVDVRDLGEVGVMPLGWESVGRTPVGFIGETGAD